MGTKFLDEIHNGTFDAYREHYSHQSIDTTNRDLGAAIRVLGRAARLWRDDVTGLSWLATQPLILLKKNPDKRHAYPLSHDEQSLLFEELARYGDQAPHLAPMALFDVNTGLRDQELCGLEWAWERRVPELDTRDIKRSVFVLPSEVAKNTEPPLRHTFGRRLRAAGVSFEDRQDLLGHKSRRVTTEYSAAELGNLIEAANKVNAVRRSPTVTMLRMTRKDSKPLTVNGGW